MQIVYFPLLFPLLLAAYPVINLYSLNSDRLYLSVTYLPLVVVLIVAAVLMLVSCIAFDDMTKGSLWSGIVLFLSSLLGQTRYVLRGSFSETHLTPLVDFVLLALLLAVAAGMWRSVQKLRRPERYIPLFNLLTVLLLTAPIVRLTTHAHAEERPEPGMNPTMSTPLPPNQLHYPDIYYIILDGYGRKDILSKYYSYDNRAFTDFLKKKGFFVAEQSRSNYAFTFLSLSSSLNMTYINDLNQKPWQEREALRLLRMNRLSQFLKSRGYTVIHLASGWYGTDTMPLADTTYRAASLNEFNSLLIQTSLFHFLFPNFDTDTARTCIQYNLQKLAAIPPSSAPRFVFAHILCPHPPFVFDRQGHRPPPREYPGRSPGVFDWYPKERYVDQLAYVTTQIQKVLAQILKTAKNPPIIILQSDHGPACFGQTAHPLPPQICQRMGILNAYYFPSGGKEKLYPSISPVNSFRVVLDTYFGTHLGRLPDRNFYSGPVNIQPYRFTDVTHVVDTLR